MRWLVCFASMGVLALAANAYAQGEKKEPTMAEKTTAVYLVAGLH